MKLTPDLSREILSKHCTEGHLLTHALAVAAAMGAMADHFGEDREHWFAVGLLHDVDYEEFPEEHTAHVEEMLAPFGIDEDDIRAIRSHGWGLCSDVEPQSTLEKSLFTVDELTGIISAASLMRPTGITDLGVSSLKKKFKDKRFAAKCDRDIIQQGCDRLGMDIGEVMELCISGMREHTDELGLGTRE